MNCFYKIVPGIVGVYETLISFMNNYAFQMENQSFGNKNILLKIYFMHKNSNE